MPVSYLWYNPNKSILLVKFEDQWTWNEMYLTRQAVLDDYTGDTIVDVIADFRNTHELPPNVMLQGRKALEKVHPNQGLQVFLSVPATLKKLLDIAPMIMPKVVEEANYTFADTFDEALKIIEAQYNP